MKNYRPVSNLSFIKNHWKSCILRLNEHVENTGCFPKLQSAYRQKHSTETALLKVHNDLVRLMGQGKTVVLVLLDLSAAFDTIDIDILCDRLHTNFVVGGSALGGDQIIP